MTQGDGHSWPLYLYPRDWLTVTLVVDPVGHYTQGTGLLLLLVMNDRSPASFIMLSLSEMVYFIRPLGIDKTSVCIEDASEGLLLTDNKYKSY